MGAIRTLGGLALLVLAIGGCGDGGRARRLETIDVEPPITVDTTADPQAPPVRPSLSGVLPGDFPSDLPLHLPASLVDFGRRSVSLLTPDPPSLTRSRLRSAAQARGWEVAAGGNGVEHWSKDGRAVVLRLEPAPPGTVYRYEY